MDGVKSLKVIGPVMKYKRDFIRVITVYFDEDYDPLEGSGTRNAIRYRIKWDPEMSLSEICPVQLEMQGSKLCSLILGSAVNPDSIIRDPDELSDTYKELIREIKYKGIRILNRADDNIICSFPGKVIPSDLCINSNSWYIHFSKRS